MVKVYIWQVLEKRAKYRPEHFFSYYSKHLGTWLLDIASSQEALQAHYECQRSYSFLSAGAALVY